jgi:hypothetical protein
MRHYIVSYDLHNQRNYPAVWEYLEGLGGTRLLESLWVLSHSATAGQIRDGLKMVMDGDDSCAVIELKQGSGWATQKARDAGVEWLRQNILS